MFVNNIFVYEQQIFDKTIGILEARRASTDTEAAGERKRFSRAFKTESTANEIYIVCLHKLEKLAKMWTKNKGVRGYLDFIGNFIN